MSNLSRYKNSASRPTACANNTFILIPYTRFSPTPFFQVLPPKPYSGPAEVRDRVLSDAKMINPKLCSFIMDSYFNIFLVLKASIINILAVTLTSLKQKKLNNQRPFTLHRESLGPSFKSPEGKPFL